MKKLRPFVLGSIGCAILLAVLATGGVQNLFAEVTKVLPVFVTNDPARQPFQKNVSFEFDPASGVGSADFDVPAGKRLVIEFVSARFHLPPGAGPVEFTVTTTQNSHPSDHFFGTSFGGTRGTSGDPSAIDLYTASQITRLYSEAGTNSVSTFATLDPGGTGLVGQITFSGYLVDVP